MSKDLKSLAKEILADCVIDAQEVKKIREVIYEDKVIDKDEADFLFELNNATSGKNNHSSWKELFVEAISSYLLDDEKSPGEVDAEEAKWLVEKVEGDGKCDENEKALLLNIKKKAKSISKELENKIKNLGL